jgi:hypothetical protein
MNPWVAAPLLLEDDMFSEVATLSALAEGAVRGIFLHMIPAIDSEHVRVAHARQVAIYRAMTPTQRLQQALRMNRTMRELMGAGFRQRNPTWTETEIRRAVADRILYARTG